MIDVITRYGNQNGTVVFTIPAEDRRDLGINAGDFVRVDLTHDGTRVGFIATARRNGAPPQAGVVVTIPRDVVDMLDLTEYVDLKVKLTVMDLVPR